MTVNTSDFLGVGRCPGSIKYDDFTSTAVTSVKAIDDVPNYHDLAFVSFNPDPAAEAIASGSTGSTTLTVSAITSGLLKVDDLIYGPNIVDGTTIVSTASTASITASTDTTTTITVTLFVARSLATSAYTVVGITSPVFAS